MSQQQQQQPQPQNNSSFTYVVPGPTLVPRKFTNPYGIDYGSGDLDEQYFVLYENVEKKLQKLLVTNDQMLIMTGEAMLGLWGGLKSIVNSSDKVLVVANGVYGEGFGEMAQMIGAQIEVVSFEYDQSYDISKVDEVAQRFHPTVITAVHCETPSGTLNPIHLVGEIAKKVGALFFVDFVSSGAGTQVLVKEWNIDIGILGSQKALSLIPDLTIVTVSENAWKRIEQIKYFGYDALLPWKDAVKQRLLPYTPNWHSTQSLSVALDSLFEEGLEKVYQRHKMVASYCRKRLGEIGIELFPISEKICSPTVTAAKIPKGWTWKQFNEKLLAKGIVVGGSYGKIAGQVFRIGHMGSQANLDLINKVIDGIQEILQ